MTLSVTVLTIIGTINRAVCGKTGGTSSPNKIYIQGRIPRTFLLIGQSPSSSNDLSLLNFSCARFRFELNRSPRKKPLSPWILPEISVVRIYTTSSGIRFALLFYAMGVSFALRTNGVSGRFRSPDEKQGGNRKGGLTNLNPERGHFHDMNHGSANGFSWDFPAR